jgi:hypothetical protein
MTTIKMFQQLKCNHSEIVLEVYGINSRNKTYHCKAITENENTPLGTKFNVSFRSVEKQYTYVN